MKEIAAADVTALVSQLYQEANFRLPDDVTSALEEALLKEESELGREVLATLIRNSEIAAGKRLPLCQDTGLAVVFAEVGQDVHLSGATLQEAVDAGVARAHSEGYLRASVVRGPLGDRQNTGDNTPAMLHTEIAAGEGFTLTVLPKGAGSENMSRLAMLKPADGIEGLVRFAVETVEKAGASPCPPVFLGVGVGGAMDTAAILAKKALIRGAGVPHRDPALAALERRIKDEVDALGIGPGGLGGTVTCLGVAIETYPCHIASLPVAVNIQCNSNRRATASL